MVLSYDYEDAISATTSEVDKKFWDYFEASSTASFMSNVNVSEVQDTLPRDQAAVLATYGILLAIGGFSNIVVLVSLAKTRRRKSRIDLLMTHLVLADVCVTCGVIPLEADLCYVAQDYTAEMEMSAANGGVVERYTLPDGQQVVLGDERFQCPECIFRPSIEGLDCPGLPELICSSISKCDVDFRPLLYSNLVPSGGSSMFRGLVSRLTRDLKMRLPGVNVQVDDLPSRQFAQWGGASVTASLDHLKGFWMTNKEYQDNGLDAVNYKFF